MKKHMILSTLLLAALGAQAASFNYEFNTPSDTEEWTANSDVTGLTQATAVDGGGVGVLTSTDVTGGDPHLAAPTNLTLGAEETWDKIEFRFRLLDGNPGAGGAPLAFVNNGTYLGINAGGSAGIAVFEDKTFAGPSGDIYDLTIAADGTGEWQLLTLSFANAPTAAHSTIASIRFDLVGDDPAKNFEVDYIRVTALPLPPEVAFSYEFNTPSDAEGWTANSQVTALGQATAVGAGGEGVLTSTDLTGNDPQLAAPTNLTLGAGEIFDKIEFRFRLLDGNPGAGGAPEAFVSSGTYLGINAGGSAGTSVLENKTFAGPSGDTYGLTIEADGAGEWQLLTLSFANAPTAAASTIASIRFDLVGNNVNRNFEVDYIRVSALALPVPDVTFNYEFNTPSDVEGWTDNGQMTGLGQATAVGTRGEGVLTSSDVTDNDPHLAAPANLTLGAGEIWDNIEFRFRLLDGNPGAGGAPAAFVKSGTLLGISSAGGFASSGNFEDKTFPGPSGDIFGLTFAADGPGEWQLLTLSYANAPASAALTIVSIRFNLLGNNVNRNFEVDYIRVSARVLPFPEIAEAMPNLIPNGSFDQVASQIPAVGGVQVWNINGSYGDLLGFENRTADVPGWTPYNVDPNGLAGLVGVPHLVTGDSGDLNGSFYMDTLWTGDEAIVMNSVMSYRNGVVQENILSGVVIDPALTYTFSVRFSAGLETSTSNFTAALTSGVDATNTASAVTDALIVVTDYPTAPETFETQVNGADLNGQVNVFFSHMNPTLIPSWPNIVEADIGNEAIVAQVAVREISLSEVYVVIAGDVTKDGVVDQADVALANSYLDGTVDGSADAATRQNDLIASGMTASEALIYLNLTEFDVDGDGYFDAADVVVLEGLIPVPPVVDSAGLDGSGDFAVQVSGLEIGTEYFLMKDTDLSDGAVFDVVADSVTAASTTETLTDVDAGIESDQAFYQVTD